MDISYELDLSCIPTIYTFDDFMNESFDDNTILTYISEATATPITKENIFDKIWKIIITATSEIGTIFKKFLDAIKSLITGRSDPVITIDKIASDYVKPNSDIPTDTKSEKIKIPADKNSEIKPDDIELIYSNLLIDIDKDKNIRVNILNAAMNRNSIQVKNPSSFIAYAVPCALSIIKYPDLLDQFKNIIHNISKLMNYHISPDDSVELNRVKKLDMNYDVSSLNNDIENLAKNMCTKIPLNIFTSVKYDDIVKASKNIADLFDEITHIDKIFDKDKYENASIALCKIINLCGNILLNVQHGINCLCNGLKSVYQVNGIYSNSVKDISTLDKIVDKMISAGIPNKYIMRNIFILSDPKLYGKESLDKPKWGQTRVVFIPNNKIVYKIALNGPGIRANNAELKIYSDFTKHDIGNLLCKVNTINDSAHNTIIEAEYVGKPFTSKYRTTFAAETAARKFEQELNNQAKAAGITYTILDIHRKNIGFNNSGNPVVIDYGWFQH